MTQPHRALLGRIETEMRDNDGWTSLYEKDAIALCDALRESLDSLEGMRAERDAARRGVGFFASATRCGESWTPTCDAEYARAMGEP